MHRVPEFRRFLNIYYTRTNKLVFCSVIHSFSFSKVEKIYSKLTWKIDYLKDTVKATNQNFTFEVVKIEEFDYMDIEDSCKDLKIPYTVEYNLEAVKKYWNTRKGKKEFVEQLKNPSQQVSLFFDDSDYIISFDGKWLKQLIEEES
jgi:hypothetical protein